MPVSVTMPRLGESVAEGTVTRWLKKAGERVEADEPLLEVSTDKVDTEIPAPASGVLAEIKVGEDETVEVGVELALIDEGGTGAASGGGQAETAPPQEEQGAPPAQQQPAEEQPADKQPSQQQQSQQQPAEQAQEQATKAGSDEPIGELAAGPEQREQLAAEEPARAPSQPQGEPAPQQRPEPAQPAAQQQTAQQPTAQQPAAQAPPAQAAPGQSSSGDGQDAAYVTPLVRKLAAEHRVDLSQVQGTGVGGRIRKQDVLEAARAGGGEPAGAPEERAAEPATTGQPAQQAQPARQAQPAQPGGAPQVAPQRAAAVTQVRGRTEQLSRLRKVIAQRMVESLQVSAQLTTVVEADVTRIARLRGRAKAEFEAREGVRLSFLPFFALATVEALKAHPNVNSSIDVEAGTVTYHDAVHLGMAVDTERGLLVPVIHDAQDLNIGGLARKIADLAERTRSGQVSPDELGGGTFTLTNTGSRGALFDTPIINQPQVGILGTGAVVKRPVVIDDPDLGETIAVRSVVYLALTYDHRIIDGADAARFLGTIKGRLEEGRFEAELGL